MSKRCVGTFADQTAASRGIGLPLRVAFSALILLVSATASNAQNLVPANLVALHMNAALARIGTFGFDQRLDCYMAMDRLANRLVNSSTVSKVSERPGTAFGEKFPRLVFDDRTGEGVADMWSYAPRESERTQEFGLIFDLNRDGRADYLVFNSGLLPSSKKMERMVWRNYHLIDSNFDGRFDIMVMNGVGLNDAETIDTGVSVWLYDRDGDGQIDDGEYLGKGMRKALDRADGSFLVRFAWVGNKAYKPDLMRTWNEMFAELVEAHAALPARLKRDPAQANPQSVATAMQAQPGASPAASKLLDTGRLLVPVPSGDGWDARTVREGASVEFTRLAGGLFSRASTVINVSRNELKADVPYLTVEEIADDFSATELRDMRIRGKGSYSVSADERGIVTPSRSPAYYMRYKTSSRSANQDAVLVMLFPPAFATTREFITVVAVETCSGASCQPPPIDLSLVFPVMDRIELR